MENSNHLTESWSLPWQSVLSSQLWRLEHLYWIENKAGQLQRFSLNRAQRRLHERLWYRNDILKARQLGISTYVAMLMLDMSLFRSNFHCGIIDKSLPDAQQKLAKLHFAWDHQEPVRRGKKGGMATPYVGAQPPGFLQWERCAGGD